MLFNSGSLSLKDIYTHIKTVLSSNNYMINKFVLFSCHYTHNTYSHFTTHIYQTCNKWWPQIYCIRSFKNLSVGFWSLAFINHKPVNLGFWVSIWKRTISRISTRLLLVHTEGGGHRDNSAHWRSLDKALFIWECFLAPSFRYCLIPHSSSVPALN